MTPIRNGMPVLKATVAATRAADRVSARAAGRLAARLWFTPWRLPLSPRALEKQRAWLDGTSPTEVRAAGRRLVGYEGGMGPTVLLVHGWGDGSRSMGAFVRPLMDAGFRVAAFDMPGHGETSGGRTDALQIAASVRGIAKEIGPVHSVVAHSMGGHATMLALHDGLEVDSVVLLAPAVYLASAVEPFTQMFSLSPRTLEGLRSEIERRFGRTVWEDLAADELVRDVRVPALILHDNQDPQVPFSDTQRLVSSWPSARLESVSDLGHTRILRDERIIERTISFLATPSRMSPAPDLVRSSV